MKIAIHNAQFSYYIGGTERAICTQIKNLLQIDKELKITIVTRNTNQESIFFKEIKKLQSNRLKIELFDDSDIDMIIKGGANSSERWHLEATRFGLKTAKFYSENNFDLVISHFSTDMMFIPKKQKTILNVHGMPSSYSPLDENCFQRADYLVYTTNDINNKMNKMYPIMKCKKSRVIHLGTKIINEKYSIHERKNDILFVGRLIKIKGVETLISAVDKLKNKNRLQICIVGKGPEEENLKIITKRLGLEKNIQFISYLSDEELSNLYIDSKLAIFPSYDKEGILLSMLEAASHGCGLIVSNSCGMPEFIIHNENGLLFEPKNACELANQIDYLLTNDSERNRLGSCAFKKIRDSWNDLDKSRELYNYYLEVKND